jgi:hypothetical protein
VTSKPEVKSRPNLQPRGREVGIWEVTSEVCPSPTDRQSVVNKTDHFGGSAVSADSGSALPKSLLFNNVSCRSLGLHNILQQLVQRLLQLRLGRMIVNVHRS